MHDSDDRLSHEDMEDGSITAFRSSWNTRPESIKYHFARGKPQNQIQFAFQNHWRVFSRLLENTKSGEVLEVGCGRGSMGAFFADAGYNVHLLDTSEQALRYAQLNFAADGLAEESICGDALCLPYATGSFDAIVSIGLLEHFSDVMAPLQEQIRVLKPGGLFLGYVVPERRISVQTLGDPINLGLSLVHRALAGKSEGSTQSKAALYRNDYNASHYMDCLHALSVKTCGSFGMFPVPLISHSPNFPFTLMAPELEEKLVSTWQSILNSRRTPVDPWICNEFWGLAFLVWSRKA